MSAKLPQDERERRKKASYRKYYEKNKAARNAANSARYFKDQDRNKARHKRNYEARKTEILAKQKAGYPLKKEKKAEYQRRYLENPENRKRHQERINQWFAANPERSRAIYRACYHRAMKRPQFVAVTRLRNRLKWVLKNARKSASTMALTGCTPAELVAHIERQFKPGMTWENRSAWHIDHILPLSSFDLLDPEQQRKAAHFTNLQPLWREENLSKGAKIIQLKAA